MADVLGVSLGDLLDVERAVPEPERGVQEGELLVSWQGLDEREEVPIPIPKVHDAIDEGVVLAHSRSHPCPCCSTPAYCDGCALCEACGFPAPEVVLHQPPAPAPAPKRRCPECGGACTHSRCSSTLIAAAEVGSRRSGSPSSP